MKHCQRHNRLRESNLYCNLNHLLWLTNINWNNFSWKRLFKLRTQYQIARRILSQTCFLVFLWWFWNLKHHIRHFTFCFTMHFLSMFVHFLTMQFFINVWKKCKTSFKDGPLGQAVWLGGNLNGFLLHGIRKAAWQTMWNIAKKNQWKGSNGQPQCFYKGTSVTSGALSWKFANSMTHPGWTMSKGMGRAFRKCVTCGGGFQLISPWRGGVKKDNTHPILRF